MTIREPDGVFRVVLFVVNMGQGLRKKAFFGYWAGVFYQKKKKG